MKYNKNEINPLLGFMISQNNVIMIDQISSKYPASIIDDDYPTSIPCNYEKTVYEHTKYTQSLSSGNTKAWNHNLTGDGIIMGIGDTGLDVNHCMFYDNHQKLSYNYKNQEHRKIISYIPYIDKIDFPDGHGTHVIGIACGSSLDNNTFPTSLSFNSKLVFMDLSQTKDVIILPYDLNKRYLTILYNI